MLEQNTDITTHLYYASLVRRYGSLHTSLDSGRCKPFILRISTNEWYYWVAATTAKGKNILLSLAHCVHSTDHTSPCSRDSGFHMLSICKSEIIVCLSSTIWYSHCQYWCWNILHEVVGKVIDFEIPRPCTFSICFESFCYDNYLGFCLCFMLLSEEQSMMVFKMNISMHQWWTSITGFKSVNPQ